MRSSLRRFFFISLGVILVGAVIYRSRGALRLGQFEWVHLKNAILQVNGWYVLLAFLGIYGAYALRAERWVRLSHHLGKISFLSTFRNTLIGFTSLFLLGRAGEPIRPLLIARKERLSVSSMFGIYVLERIFDLGCTVVILGLSLLTFPNVFNSSGGSHGGFLIAVRATGTGLLLALPVIIGGLIYLRFHGSRLLESRLDLWRSQGKLRGWRGRISRLVTGFMQGLEAIRTISDLGGAVILSVAHWTLITLVYFWVCKAFGGQLAAVGIPGAMLALAFSMVGSTVQLPGVGGGSQVACYVALTVVLGVEEEPAAAAAILIWLITFVACSVAGIPLLLREGWTMGELRKMARTEAPPATAAESPKSAHSDAVIPEPPLDRG